VVVQFERQGDSRGHRRRPACIRERVFAPRHGPGGTTPIGGRPAVQHDSAPFISRSCHPSPDKKRTSRALVVRQQRHMSAGSGRTTASHCRQVRLLAASLARSAHRNDSDSCLHFLEGSTQMDKLGHYKIGWRLLSVYWVCPVSALAFSVPREWQWRRREVIRREPAEFR
jgi:hypothetical protein